MQLVLTLRQGGCQLAPSHVKRDFNTWADELTHPSDLHFDELGLSGTICPQPFPESPIVLLFLYSSFLIDDGHGPAPQGVWCLLSSMRLTNF